MGELDMWHSSDILPVQRTEHVGIEDQIVQLPLNQFLTWHDHCIRLDFGSHVSVQVCTGQLNSAASPQSVIGFLALPDCCIRLDVDSHVSVQVCVARSTQVLVM